MPSGMEYRRALPYTWLNAQVATRMGTDREEAYRVGGAVIGSAAPAVLFAVGATFVGIGPAFVAGSLLALSEWHVSFSRMARMYVPFVFFYVLAAFSLWKWGTTGAPKYLWLSIFSVATTISLHALGVFVLQFAVLPLLFTRTAVVSAPRLLGFAAASGGLGWAYDRFFVTVPYRAWPNVESAQALGQQQLPSVIPTVNSPTLALAAAFLAAVVGVYIYRRMDRAGDDRSLALPDLALALSATVAIAAVFVGQLLAAVAAITIGLILDRDRSVRLFVRERWVVGAVAGVAMVWAIGMIVTQGVSEGIKDLAYFPYPYAITLLRQQPVVFLLAAGATLAAILGDRDKVPVRALALAVLLPILAMGVVSRWGPARYFFQLYPMILLLAALGLTDGLGWLLSKARVDPATGRKWSLVAASALVLSGALGQHGVPQTLRVNGLEHGDPTDPDLHMTATRPDHAGAGRYVREHARAEDLIVAVDVLEQAWYIGRVDYWLRGEEDAAPFLYLEDGVPRDIYVSAQLLRGRADLDRILARADPSRTWLITSAEVEPDDERAFNEEQREILAELSRDVDEVFLASDGRTRVYCLRCPELP